ncbi:LysR family transcriptional regulator [Hahella aquimaris]|uniref:LysR family transcriptional regulator n=1 Tax=Hahella sp. HNIBRBA332 TaxID=3015983 RepID=UPI00273BCC5F|nr:LysR family transcriptional regulator [Hahella sp. HNIBRBA332]WLQ13711.1 LysR family transcriptional regulator [Hahella sp. HNIBRBA332]
MATRFGFDLRALSIFAHVAKTGNMSHSAEQLGMTQSSISQALSKLEESLQTRLFDRTVRPMELTSAGRFLYDRSTSLLQEAEQTSQAILQSDFAQLRLIKIALTDSIVTSVGRSLLDAVKKRAHDWSISTGLSHLHGHSLLSRNTDIIISDDALEDYADLSRYRILREPFILALPNDYNGPADDLNKLAMELDFVRYGAHSLIARGIERHLRAVRVEAPDRLQLDNSYAIVSAVSAGMGWTITTPLCLFQSGIKQHHVQIRRLPGEQLFRSITLTARKGELGDLPREIAQDCIAILRQDFLSLMATEHPWMMEFLTLGD